MEWTSDSFLMTEKIKIYIQQNSQFCDFEKVESRRVKPWKFKNSKKIRPLFLVKIFSYPWDHPVFFFWSPVLNVLFLVDFCEFKVVLKVFICTIISLSHTLMEASQTDHIILRISMDLREIFWFQN